MLNLPELFSMNLVYDQSWIILFVVKKMLLEEATAKWNQVHHTKLSHTSAVP